jgi:hypothetical protein
MGHLDFYAFLDEDEIDEKIHQPHKTPNKPVAKVSFWKYLLYKLKILKLKLKD